MDYVVNKNEKINKDAIILLLIVFFPYSILPSIYTILFFVTLTLVKFYNKALNYFYISMPLFCFVLYAFMMVLLAVYHRKEISVVISQSNHIFQFFIYYTLFSNIFRNVSFVSFFTRNIIFYLCLCLMFIFFVKVTFLGRPDYSGLDINFVSLMVAIWVFIQGKSSGTKLLYLIFFLFFSISIASRSSFLFIVFVFVFVFVFFNGISLPRYLVNISALFIILLPIFLALGVSYSSLDIIYQDDFNAGIRLEFLRSAMSNLDGINILGLGFGLEYRNISYDYLINHVFLVDEDGVNIISNHHSVFDTYYRLGIVGVTLFLYSILIKNSGRTFIGIEVFLVISISVGLSVDAWFENQLQMPMFAYLSALLMYIRECKIKLEKNND